MHVFRDSLALRTAGERVPALSDHLNWLLSEVSEEAEKELDQVLAVVVAEAGDDLDHLAAALGFDPREEPVENITVLPGWFELTFIVNGEGFGYVVYVPNDPNTSSDLIRFCRAHLPSSASS